MTLTIFLADDHAIVRDGLRSILAAEPDTEVVGEASNGREAVRQIAELCPNVAVLDISMPELNGIEATRKIQDLSPTTQVIILSMHSSTEHVYRALRAGACGFVLKDSAGSELVHAIKTVYAGHRHLSPQISDRLIEDYVLQRQKTDDSPLSRLTQREREVLQLVAEGRTSIEIADGLALSPRTIDTYRSRIMKKLELEDITELTKFAIQHGLISLE